MVGLKAVLWLGVVAIAATISGNASANLRVNARVLNRALERGTVQAIQENSEGIFASVVFDRDGLDGTVTSVLAEELYTDIVCLKTLCRGDTVIDGAGYRATVTEIFENGSIYVTAPGETSGDFPVAFSLLKKVFEPFIGSAGERGNLFYCRPSEESAEKLRLLVEVGADYGATFSYVTPYKNSFLRDGASAPARLMATGLYPVLTDVSDLGTQRFTIDLSAPVADAEGGNQYPASFTGEISGVILSGSNALLCRIQ